MADKEMILPESEKAARRVEGLSGWVAPNGQWWGDDERMARWCGATHVHCKGCGEPVEKHWVLCAACRGKKEAEKYAARKAEEWDGASMLYSEVADRYFEDEDDLEDYCDVMGVTPDTLRLVLCEPVYAHEIDPNDYYTDDLAEDGEVNGVIEDAFAVLNEAIKGQILSWTPGKIAAIVHSAQPESVDAVDPHALIRER